ncbi:hypothetical protein KIN20_004684 [Parelaphostrongylus tenuis]|uniref:ATP synthase subunit s-like protein n=1 Tax=Parelaphostrongylus tenuis TaxID=148309 RepID=A0AAD5QEM5_PARTN|nr:hypothetical protein KIN20_004684 [Parelaphostrongylus tenuis]
MTSKSQRLLLSVGRRAAVVNGFQKRTGFVHKWSSFKRWQELVKAREEDDRDLELQKNFLRFPTGMYLTPERPQDVLPKKALADQTRKDTGALPMEMLTFYTQMRYVDHSFDNIRRYRRYQHFQHLQYDQRMIPERLLFLGPDLAAAHFLVHRDASVKFLGDDTWYKKDKNNRYSLPGTKVPGLYLEAIDASGTELMFEGFENLQNLDHLRMLRLADCPYIDDWTLSRIGGMMTNLEMLDLSGCHRVSAKGLMGLKMLKSLKYLRLEGINTKNLGKAALLLEETIPKLKVLGIDYEHELQALEADLRLLENPNVVEDAKGNLFAEDDNGRLFYVGGSVNERPAVCDNDKPIMTSTIRREIPKMSDEEFEKLDLLSGGKLRHLLVGSPSGYEWNAEVETILQFEAEYNEKRGIPVDPKMLPRSRRKMLPQEEKQSLLDNERMKFLNDFDEEWKALEDIVSKTWKTPEDTVPETSSEALEDTVPESSSEALEDSVPETNPEALVKSKGNG